MLGLRRLQDSGGVRVGSGVFLCASDARALSVHGRTATGPPTTRNPDLPRAPQDHHLASPSPHPPTPTLEPNPMDSASCWPRPSPRTSEDPLAGAAPGLGSVLSGPGLLPSGAASFPAVGAPSGSHMGPDRSGLLLTGLQSQLPKNKGQRVSNSAIIQSSVFKAQRFFCFIRPQLSNCISTAIVILFLFLIAIIENRASQGLREAPTPELPSNVNVLCKCPLRREAGAAGPPGREQEKNAFWGG